MGSSGDDGAPSAHVVPVVSCCLLFSRDSRLTWWSSPGARPPRPRHRSSSLGHRARGHHVRLLLATNSLACPLCRICKRRPPSRVSEPSLSLAFLHFALYRFASCPPAFPSWFPKSRLASHPPAAFYSDVLILCDFLGRPGVQGCEPARQGVSEHANSSTLPEQVTVTSQRAEPPAVPSPPPPAGAAERIPGWGAARWEQESPLAGKGVPNGARRT